jgi:hypothetical protein
MTSPDFMMQSGASSRAGQSSLEPNSDFSEKIELSQRALAGLLGVSAQNVPLWERHGKIPEWGARWVKVLHTEKLDGNVHVKTMTEQLNARDDKPPEPLHFKTRSEGPWKAAA